jgi:cell division transport system permease protein
MASSFENYNKRRLISSYFSVVLSIFLVLFLLGTLGLFVINSKKISDDFKENIPMTVFFNNEATDSVISSFDLELKNANFIKDYGMPLSSAARKQRPLIDFHACLQGFFTKAKYDAPVILLVPRQAGA